MIVVASRDVKPTVIHKSRHWRQVCSQYLALREANIALGTGSATSAIIRGENPMKRNACGRNIDLCTINGTNTE